MFSSYIKKYLRQLLANKFTLIGLSFLLITAITKPAQQSALPSTIPDVTAETAENFMGQYLFAHIHDAQKEMACLRFYTPYIRKPHNLTPGQILYLAEHRPWELSEKTDALQQRNNLLRMPIVLETEQQVVTQKQQPDVKKSARIALRATFLESKNKRACQESSQEEDIIEVTSGSESGLEDNSQDDADSDDQAACQADKEAAKNIPTLVCPLCKTHKNTIGLHGLSRHLRNKHNTTLHYFAKAHPDLYKIFFTWTTLTSLKKDIDYERSGHCKKPEYSCLKCTTYNSKNALTFALHFNSIHRTPEEVTSATVTLE